MEYIQVTKENIETEHICCALSNNKDCQVQSKKAWLLEQFEHGLVFLKGNVKGKCFIEYVPAEYAWVPIKAEGYLYIDCLWVSGKLQGNGYAHELLEQCKEDGRKNGKAGLVILSSKKKKPYLADPVFLEKEGFVVCDSAEPFYELYYLPLQEDAEEPTFLPQVKKPQIKEDGYVLYYTNQCPFTAKYVPLVEQLAKENGIPFHVHQITSVTEARRSPVIRTTYSLYYNGTFVTHEVLNEKRFQKILDCN